MSGLRLLSVETFEQMRSVLLEAGQEFAVGSMRPRSILASLDAVLIEAIAEWCQQAEIPFTRLKTRLAQFLLLENEAHAVAVKLAFV